MTRQIISTPDAPAAIGTYSQAVRVGPAVYISGQIPLDPATGQLVPGGIREQTGRVLENIKAVLASQGIGVEHVVKTTVFMTNLADFAAMNEVYAKSFPANPPARSTVQVVALPKGAQVEIEVIAAY